MINLALLGKDIQKSRSKEMYENLLKKEVNYQLLDFSEENEIPSLNEIFSSASGLSITAPYKNLFIDDVNIEAEVKSIRAINCIKKVGGDFYGTNTDYLACLEILNSFFKKNIKFFILGDGAMSRVLQHILRNNNEDFEVKSRRLGNLKDNKFSFEAIKKKYILINCCHRDYDFDGTVDASLIKFWDLNYSIDEGKHKSVINSTKYVDGIELLFLQAKYALEFWGIK